MSKPIIAVILMALVTYIPRVLPVSIFRKEIHSKTMKSFLTYVPYAVLGSLTFPDIFSSTGNLITALCGTIVALILSFFERSLVVVALGGILTVFLTTYILY